MSVALVAGILALVPAGVAPTAARADSTSPSRPIVAVVVGPTHSLTSQYLAWGEEIAQRATALGADVRRVFYPDATWANVVSAAQGASVFVYLGHGNGFPSPYTSTLITDRQDGLGLDPVAGAGENDVQYYGEKYVAADLRLAPHAVVILNHLCYASGNSEPGYPDPTEAVAEERVDNFATGFLAAGASAVFALGHEDGADILSGLFGPPQTLDQLFMAVGYTGQYDLRFASTRTPGATAHLDPEAPGAYYRSVAGYLDTLTSSVVASSGATAPALTPTAPVPTAPAPATATPAPTAPPPATTPASGMQPPSPATSTGPGAAGTAAASGAPLPAVALSIAPAVITIGQSVVLSARVDVRAGYRIVVFQERAAGAGAWSPLAAVAPGSDGLASVAVRPSVNTEYRALADGAAGQAAAASAALRVPVRLAIALQPPRAGLPIVARVGTTLSFGASVVPAWDQSAGVVTFAVARLSGGHWVTVATSNAPMDTAGHARLTWRFATHGVWSVRATARPTSSNANSFWTGAQRIDVR